MDTESELMVYQSCGVGLVGIFKVGDKVKQSAEQTYLFLGKPHEIGTIVEVCLEEDSFDYRVDFGAIDSIFSYWGMFQHELESV